MKTLDRYLAFGNGAVFGVMFSPGQAYFNARLKCGLSIKPLIHTIFFDELVAEKSAPMNVSTFRVPLTTSTIKLLSPSNDSSLVLLVFARKESDFLPSAPKALGSPSPVTDDDDGGVPMTLDDALLKSTQSWTSPGGENAN